MSWRTQNSMPNRSTANVPTTLQASLIARFDRLSGGKAGCSGRCCHWSRVRPFTACCGREMPEAELTHALDTLVEAGLAFRRGMPPDAIYTFKHALVRDAVYNTLLRSQRQELHAVYRQRS